MPRVIRHKPETFTVYQPEPLSRNCVKALAISALHENLTDPLFLLVKREGGSGSAVGLKAAESA
jgi:hypothetical protein